MATTNINIIFLEKGHSLFCMMTSPACIGLILYIPSTIVQLNRDGSSWVEPVLSSDIISKRRDIAKDMRKCKDIDKIEGMEQFINILNIAHYEKSYYRHSCIT